MQKENLNLSKEHFHLLVEICSNLCVVASLTPECDEVNIIKEFINKIYPHFKKYLPHYLEELKMPEI